jgi:hypothetical protein
VGKPYGLTATLEIIAPDRATDALWDAVEQARLAGMTVRQIKLEMQEAWEHACEEEKQQAKEFTR